MTTIETPPNPGSKEAIEIGCNCPISDNHYGEGIDDGIFYISGDCPVHDSKPTL